MFFFSYLQILTIQQRKYLLEFQGAGNCPEQHHAQCNRCKTIHYRIPGISPSRNQFGGKVFVDVSPTEKQIWNSQKPTIELINK